jgi:hypothetical protein
MREVGARGRHLLLRRYPHFGGWDRRPLLLGKPETSGVRICRPLLGKRRMEGQSPIHLARQQGPEERPYGRTEVRAPGSLFPASSER